MSARSPIRQEPTQQRLREIFICDPEAGMLSWKNAEYSGFGRPKNNGSKDACADNGGYKVIHVDGRPCRVNRLMWIHQIGDIPDGIIIDHRDGNTGNDRLRNLRATNYSGNQKNRRRGKNNRSGVSGVYFNKAIGKWQASIMSEGRRNHIGCFESIADAESAVKSKRAELGFSERHGT